MTLVLPINKKQGPIYLLKDRYPDVQDFKTGKIKGLWMPWQKGNYMGSDTSLQCTQDLLLSGDPNNPYYAPYSSFGVDDFSLKYWPKHGILLYFLRFVDLHYLLVPFHLKMAIALFL